jgi:photosystem II stability/assembly factor-like uncharacterized protein
MNRLLVALLALLLLSSIAATAEWTFVKSFPDPNFKWPLGSQGITVDPDGKVWIQIYNPTDSIFDGTRWRQVRQIFVFNSDGSPAPFSGFKTVTIGGVTDTLYNSSRGMRTAKDGNVLFTSLDKMYKVDYKSGAGIAMVQPLAGTTLTAPAVDTLGNVFVGAVLAGYPLWKYNAALTLLGNAIDAMPDLSRSFEVSASGSRIYWAGFTIGKVLVYGQQVGQPNRYWLEDSIGLGMAAESFARHPKSSLIWMSAGSDMNPPSGGWSKFTWYEYNWSTRTFDDSIKWNLSVSPPDSRPRGIAFSPGGSTAYVAAFNTSDPCIQKFNVHDVVYETEPNNTAAQANLNGFGILDGAIDPAGDIDYFQFSAAVGDTIVITTDNRAGSQLDGYLKLYAPDGALHSQNDNYGDSTHSKIVYIASNSGTHYIRYAYRTTAGDYPNSVGPDPSSEVVSSINERASVSDDRLSSSRPRGTTILAETGQYRLRLNRFAPSLPAAFSANPMDSFWDQTGFGAQVDPCGLPTTVVFEYGLTSTYGLEVAATGNPFTGLYELNAPVFHVSGFAASTVYHVRARVTNAIGTTYSPDNSFTTPGYPEGWVYQGTTTQQTLRGVSLVNTNTATSVGNNGNILRTTDGGANWFVQTSGTTTHLRGVAFVDANNGIVSGQLGTILRTTDGGATWNAQTSGTTKHLYVVSFADANNAWIVGEGGTILHTTNGGTSWTPQSSGTTEWLWGVDFSDANMGTAVGNNGTIRRTTNGGTTWFAQSSGSTANLLGVCLVNSSIGTVVGEQETILHTTNGGGTWQAQSTGQGGGFYYAVAFTDANKGTAVGSRLLQTSDGGASWNWISSGTSNALYAVSFSDANNGVAVGQYGTILRTRGIQIYPEQEPNNTSSQANALIYGDSIDAAISPEGDIDYFFFTGHPGDFVEIFSRNMPGGATLDGMLWLYDNAGNLMASNDDFPGDNTRSKISWGLQYEGKYYIRHAHYANPGTYPNQSSQPTDDAAERLTGVQSVPMGTPKTPTIFATTGNYRIGVGRVVPAAPAITGMSAAGVFWNCAYLTGMVDAKYLNTTVTFEYGLTTAYGNSVTALENPIMGNMAVGVNSPKITGLVPNTTYHFRIIASNALGTAYGADGAFTTAPVPEGWTLQTSGTSLGLRGVSFSDGNTGTAVGLNNTILRTTDGGTTWSSQSTIDPAWTLRDVSFVNGSTGTVVGTGGLIRRTTDGGSTWSTQTSGTRQFIRAVHFVNANDGVAVGDSAIILRTTNGGTTWNLQYANGSQSLRGVALIDPNTCTVVGNPGLIMRTTNGGSTWSAQTSGTTATLGGVSFLNANSGWVVGQTGTVLHTTDGGASWGVQSSGTSAFLSSVAFEDAYNGVIVCNDGTILRTTNAGTTWLKQSSGTRINLIDVAYVSPHTWYAVGEYGVILRWSGTSAWHAGIVATDGCGGRGGLLWGLASGATDGLDIALGEAELPPLPPAGIFDARFIIPATSSVPSLTDFRSDTTKSAIWHMQFQPGACGYPLTFTWDSSALPNGVFTLRDEVVGTAVNVDMKRVGSYTLANSALTALRIEYTSEVCRDVQVKGGWNVLSVPSLPQDSSVATLFPGATTQAYAYNNAYVVATHMRAGKGYWLKFGVADTFTVCGKQIRPMDVAVAAGWNIIGPYDAVITVAGITTTPTGIIGSNFYGYDNGYVVPTTLKPGVGYWIKTTQAGVLNLGAGATKREELAVVDPAWIMISLQDGAGHSGTLYLARGVIKTFKPDLPPLPPVGEFDVRFAGDRYVEQAGVRSEIQLNGVVYPLTLQLSNLQGAKVWLSDVDGGGVVKTEVEEGKGVVVLREVRGLEISVEGGLPTTFDLSQNYPNPFNPTTVIRYQLPMVGNVKLVVYDMLGREVATLVNEVKEPGYYTVAFEARNFASGVYIYRMTAVSFTAVRKMAVVK